MFTISSTNKPGRPHKLLKGKCHRGHDLFKDGYYIRKKSVVSKAGKRYTYITKECRRCMIENVQNCVRRKKLSKLPNRRQGITQRIMHVNSAGSTDKIIITANFDPKTNRIKEVFAANPMVGSDIEAILTDGCILISLCLQHGISLGELISKLGDKREHSTSEIGMPTSHFGAIVRAAKLLDDELNRIEVKEETNETNETQK